MKFTELLDLHRGERSLIEGATSLQEPGFQTIRHRFSEREFMEAARLIDRAMRGDRRAAFVLQEAMSTSDFPILTGQILERTVLANYQDVPLSWPLWCKRGTLRDLTSTAERIGLDRGQSVLDGPIVPNAFGASGSGPTGVKELTEYPERRRGERHWTVRLYKYGARMEFSWELFLADDLDQLKDTPALFGRAAANTVESLATRALADANGPNATFFTVANGNIVQANAQFATPINPPISANAIGAAITQLMTQLNLEGEPIALDGFTLVYPPNMDIAVKQILGASQLLVSPGFLAAGTTLMTANWVGSMVKPACNYWLPVVSATANGATSWYIIANPLGGRPAFEVDFLAGHESPEIFMKASNQVPVGGGLTDPMGGDFDTDKIVYKVRHCVGGGALDPRMAVASNGSGA